jgi:hypothetical protein
MSNVVKRFKKCNNFENGFKIRIHHLIVLNNMFSSLHTLFLICFHLSTSNLMYCISFPMIAQTQQYAQLYLCVFMSITF